ncbi:MULTISPECIES: YxeA family protein [Staphylococcus]|uniref:YxeA family protein n=1 Tax=Staphylococcus TaxID=1279 RepID=UPI000BC2FB64|nr:MULTISPECIES: YxeA family protein [Staphylococcus]ATH61136.1 hypothetical protein BJD96_12985 [Staphylococcus nepalensis]ATH66167.1 hypothetical protein BJG89_12995 [Staphylococcus nepalensis]NWN85767.1 YxeA family protein [Staphylococcus sp.]
MNKPLKTLIIIIIIIVIIFVGLFVWKVYAEKNSDNASVVDFAKLNPLIQNEDYYVKTQKPSKVTHRKMDDGERITTYNYKQNGYNTKGNKQSMDFNSFDDRPLKTNHYLKLEAKLGHVQSYEEIPKHDVPKKALNKLQQ